MGDLSVMVIGRSLGDLVQIPNGGQGVANSLIRLQDGRGQDLPISMSGTDVTVHGDLVVEGSLVGELQFPGDLVVTGTHDVREVLRVGTEADIPAGWNNGTQDILVQSCRVVSDADVETNTVRGQVGLAATSALTGTRPISAIDGELVVRAGNTQDWSGSVPTNAVNAYVAADTGSTGTIARIAGFQTSGVWNGATMTTFHHFSAQDLSGTGTLGTVVGFYAPTFRGTTANYAFYGADTTVSVFGGDTHIGGTPGSSGNRVKITGAAAGSGPTIAADGGDTNAPLNLAGKGNKGVAISHGYLNIQDTAGSNPPSGWMMDYNGGNARFLAPDGAAFRFLTAYGNEQMRVLHAANANHYTTAIGSNGGMPAFGVDGVSADIDLGLIPKGAGVVSFGSHTSTSDTAISGYITVKDSGGTVRKLAVIS